MKEIADWLAPSGLSIKDFIAPSSFEFKSGSMFGMGHQVGAVSFLQILAPELNDRMLADFLDMESSLIVTMRIQSIGERHQDGGAENHGSRFHGAGSGLEPRYPQPRGTQVHPILHRRNAPAAEGGTDGGLHRGNLEAVPQVGRHPDRNHPKHQGPAFLPRN